jgi:hypothetical protein
MALPGRLAHNHAFLDRAADALRECTHLRTHSGRRNRAVRRRGGNRGGPVRARGAVLHLSRDAGAQKSAATTRRAGRSRNKSRLHLNA